MNVETILFDMDGIVIDSERLHIEAMALTLKKFEIEFPHGEINDFVGRSDESFFQYVYDDFDNKFSITEMLDEKNRQFDILINELQFIEGFNDFMSQVQARKLKTALVTSSSAYSVGRANDILNHTKLFDVVIAEESTSKHKPNPEPYLLALEETNSAAHTAVVIEDSINGIIAGKAAGCIVVGLTTSFDEEKLIEAGADYVFDSFNELGDFLDTISTPSE